TGTNEYSTIPRRSCRHRSLLRGANGATVQVFAHDPATPVHRLTHEDLIAATERTGQELTHSGLSFAPGTTQRHSRCEARRAPCTRAANLAHMTVGCWR